jgi:site-specific DNA-methyltransferase (adenine-specific)
VDIKPYYEEPGITIYNADCRDVLPQLEPVDLVLTDPPYGTEDLGGGYGRRQNHDPNGRHGRRIANDKDLSIIAEAIPMIKERLSSPGIIISFCAPRRMIEVDRIFNSHGFCCMGELIWDKGTPGLGYTVRYSHESALIYSLSEIPTPTNALKSLIRWQVSHIDTEKKHPHEKPVSFWINSMKINFGTILDPFMGSGTTLRAAKDLGRKAIGIEIEKKYCDIAVERLRQGVLL